MVSFIRLDQEKLELKTVSSGGLFEGESRSHAFSQKKLSDGTYLFSLPTVKAWTFDGGSSSLSYFRVNAKDSSMVSLGSVDSKASSGNCQSSCVDWYGNARPIFLGDRIFGLMGHELIELKLEGGLGIGEVS